MEATDTLRLLLTGDSIITRHALVRQDEATQRLVEMIQAADVAFTNLEVLVNDYRGYPALESGGTHFAVPPWVVDDLVEAGFDLFATATNHALDYSIEGLLAMIENLDAMGVHYAGVGRNLAEARMPVYFEHPAATVAMLACTSTFGTGQLAAEQRPDMQGRPGINPLRYDTTYVLPPAHFAALRESAEMLGLEDRRLERIQRGFGFPPDDPAIFPFLDHNFREGEPARIETVPKEQDLEAIATWVREARNRADIVLVSLHAHERGDSDEQPAEFIPIFARRMIDEGADMVVGHGPHLLRGMEIYRGKPIFYSLGNFIGQNDLVYKIPADAYDRFRTDQSKTPSEVFRNRSDDGRRGFPADRRFWECVVPTLTFEGGRITAIDLVPVSLGHGAPVHRRGRPRLAQGDEAAEILQRFARLCEPYGTTIDIDGEQATVRLPEG